MKFFSGFCFDNEKKALDGFLVENDFSIAGFSYGAQKAFLEAYNTKKRVDLLQLFSPAFFQNTNDKFKKLQLISFRKNKEEYLKNFYKNAFYPSSSVDQEYKKTDTVLDLENLLYFIWDKNKLKKLKERNVEIEVYIGEKDKIVNIKEVQDFFKDFAKIYFLNKKGHVLWI